MKKRINLYAVEGAPNGTNDLLVVNADSLEIIDCIPEALFGFKRTGFWNSLKRTALVTHEGFNCLLYIQSPDQFDPTSMCMVGRISRRDVLKYLAVSPVLTEKNALNRVKEYI